MSRPEFPERVFRRESMGALGHPDILSDSQRLAAVEALAKAAFSAAGGGGPSLPGIAFGAYTVANATGNASISGIGFRPRLILAFGGPNTGTSAGWACVGCVVDDSQPSVSSAGTDEGAVAWTATPTATAQRRANGEFFALIGSTGTVLNRFTIVSFNSDGFTFNRVTNNTTAYGMYWLAIE